MYTIFSHSINVCYKTPVFSKATIFYFISFLLTFFPPLLITYRSQGKIFNFHSARMLFFSCFYSNSTGFWRKVDTYEEQPDIHFLHEVLIVLDTNRPDHKIAWSTMKNFNQIMINAARIPTIKVHNVFFYQFKVRLLKLHSLKADC